MDCASGRFFFFNDTATTEIYTLSLHDALPISSFCPRRSCLGAPAPGGRQPAPARRAERAPRSEEHTSELQSPCNLVCRLLLEKKKFLAPDPLPVLSGYAPEPLRVSACVRPDRT